MSASVFQFLQRSTTLRWYRGNIHERIRNEPVMQLLPALAELPLIVPETSGLTIATLLVQHPLVALRGLPGSGRSLVMLQIARHWAAGNRPMPLLYLPLARADRPDLPPSAVLAEAFEETGLPSPLKSSNGDRAAPSWLLLLDEWEMLPEVRRAEWYQFILTLPEMLTQAQIVLALPAEAEAPTGFHAVDMGTPDDGRLRQWLAHLLPKHDPAPILTALQPGAALAMLQQRLLEIALLALVYPVSGLPGSRAQLYEWASELYQQARPGDAASGTDARRLSALTAAALPFARSRRAETAPAEPLLFGIGQMQHACYETACMLATSGDLLPVAEMSTQERAEVALLLTSLLDDPSPLYARLWPEGQPAPADMLLLARCIYERPMAAPQWGIRLLATLAEHSGRRPYQALLEALGPLLPALLAESGDGVSDEQARTLLSQLARAVGARPLLALIHNTAKRSALRWAAADALLCLPRRESSHLLVETRPPDTLAKAICCYVLALGDTESRQLLAASSAADWLHALQDERVSQQHCTRAVHALLNDEQTPVSLRTPLLALLSQTSTPDSQDIRSQHMLLQICTDNAATIRQAALTSLQEYSAERALLVLSNILLQASFAWDIQRDALEHLRYYMQGDASVLLARCTLAAHLPLAGRLQALRLLAERGQAGGVLLRRLLRTSSAHLLIRATAVRLLAQRGAVVVFSECCQLAAHDESMFVRQAAIEAIGVLAPSVNDLSEAVAVLQLMIQHDPGNTALSIAAIQVLGRLGLPESVLLLRGLLTTDIAAAIRAAWLDRAPELATLPVADWYSLPMSAESHLLLLTILTQGATDADQPGSFDEFIEQQALEVRQAAAEALAHIARANPSVQQEIRASLLAAIQGVATLPSHEASHLLLCLRLASADDGLHDLSKLLSHPTLEPALRWLAIDQLADHPEAPPILLRCLEQGVLDSFTRGKLAYTLGRQRASIALSVLRQLADQRDGDMYVRVQAIAGLGLLPDSSIETTLLHIVADVTTPPTLRGAAAEALPNVLRADMRHWLYELLRRERQPAELVAGILQALGRSRDHEAIALMLHYVQHEHPAVAMAALTALGDLGDPAIAPNVIRITQNRIVDQRVRLHAVGVLIRLCGSEYLPLLRTYLESNVLSLQLPALDLLLSLRPNDSRPLVLITHKTAPQALRLRAIELLKQRSEDHGVLCNLLLDSSDDLLLRSAAARILGTSDYAEAVPVLARCAQDASISLRLRRQCIAALARQAGTIPATADQALLALSRIAESLHQSSATATTTPAATSAAMPLWATHMLMELTL